MKTYKSNTRIIRTIAAVLVGLSWSALAAEETTTQRDRPARDYVPLFDRTPTMQLTEVPQPVRKTIEQQAAGRKIADIDRETWSGRTVYEVEFAQTGRNAQIHVTEDGPIVKPETTGKLETALNKVFLGTQLQDAPAAVQETIKREAGSQQIVDIDKESDLRSRDSATGARNVELHIAEDGTIVRDSRKSERP